MGREIEKRFYNVLVDIVLKGLDMGSRGSYAVDYLQEEVVILGFAVLQEHSIDVALVVLECLELGFHGWGSGFPAP